MVKIEVTGPAEVEWTLGKEVSPEVDRSCRNVQGLKADGEELQTILLELQGIPKNNRPIQVWFGDDARYIMRYLGMYHSFTINHSSS